ncbi:MAG: PilZ domain-containing protein [Pseudomonadota bacterium]
MLVTIPKRRPKRVRVLLDGHIQTTEGETPVRVRDLSREGALIEVDEHSIFDVNASVKLAFLTHEVEGCVAWREGSWLGITFKRNLSAAVWKELSGKQLRVGAPRKYRHDTVEEDEERIEVTPRRIALARRNK